MTRCSGSASRCEEGRQYWRPLVRSRPAFHAWIGPSTWPAWRSRSWWRSWGPPTLRHPTAHRGRAVLVADAGDRPLCRAVVAAPLPWAWRCSCRRWPDRPCGRGGRHRRLPVAAYRRWGVALAVAGPAWWPASHTR